jgi:3-hydroxyacyl-CoA dehydrogenase
MSALVTTQHADDVAILLVDNPPVNALSPGVPEAITGALDGAERDDRVTAVVFGAAGRTFVAGADIGTLEEAAWQNPDAAADLHALLDRIERCRKPVVMAIHGSALGGGLELAMAGHFRVAASTAQLGQPEVNLGIIPGAEGTQRLPRLVGVEKALDMCVSGRPIRAADALAAGLIDAVVEGDVIAGAVSFAKEIPGIRDSRGYPVSSSRTDRLGTPETNAPLFEAARAFAAKIRRNQVAPLKVIDAIDAAATLPFEDGCRRERELFFECIRGDQAKAMIHVFFAERAAAKVPGLSKDVPALPIARVAVIGAGTMGGGIAMACANAGLDVLLKDVSQDSLDRGLATIRRNYGFSLERGRLTRDAVDERLSRIRTTLDYAGFDTADLIVEAAVEEMTLKQRIFAEIDAVAKPACVLGTNTSTLDIDAIASATSRPGSVVGLHFFSPANVMRLLEIVRGDETTPAVLATAMALGKKLGKVSVVVGNCPGFVGNRMMFPYMFESQFLVEEGATPEQVDRALTSFGMAMGMFAVDDMAGIDVAWHAKRALGHFQDASVRKPLVQDRLFEMGRLGQKTGRGWYRYDDARKASPDPEVIELIRAQARQAGIPQRTFSDEDIVERTVYALVNEGARALEDGCALRASDIDVIYVNGYGFPSWRGGPMLHADLAGLPRVLDRISSFHHEFGDRWTPAPLLQRLAAEGRTFRDYDRSLHV